MAAYRQVHITFWQDPFIEELSPKQKYFYLYLMTNSKTKQCGCYEISMKLIRYETGLTQSEIDSYIKLLAEAKKIDYDKKNQEFLIVNWLKHNSYKSPKVKTCIMKELELIKNIEFKDFIIGIINSNTTIDSLSLVYNESIDTSSQEEEEEEEEEKNNTDFDRVRKMFPGSKTVSVAKKKLPDLIKSYSAEQLIRCCERYTEYVEVKRKSEQPNLSYLNEGTFWNGRYEDYLDANYEKIVQVNTHQNLAGAPEAKSAGTRRPNKLQ